MRRAHQRAHDDVEAAVPEGQFLHVPGQQSQPLRRQPRRAGSIAGIRRHRAVDVHPRDVHVLTGTDGAVKPSQA